MSGEQWDDNTVTVASRKSVVASNGSGPTELMDMKALERKRNEQDDIVERLREEDTKAALAAARDGMEKEAQRLKEARNSKSNSNGDSSSKTTFWSSCCELFQWKKFRWRRYLDVHTYARGFQRRENNGETIF